MNIKLMLGIISLFLILPTHSIQSAYRQLKGLSAQSSRPTLAQLLPSNHLEQRNDASNEAKRIETEYIERLKQELEILNFKINKLFENIANYADSIILNYYLDKERLELELMKAEKRSLFEREVKQRQIYSLEAAFNDLLAEERLQHQLEIDAQYDQLKDRVTKSQALLQRRDSFGLKPHERAELSKIQDQVMHQRYGVEQSKKQRSLTEQELELQLRRKKKLTDPRSNFLKRMHNIGSNSPYVQAILDRIRTRRAGGLVTGIPDVFTRNSSAGMPQRRSSTPVPVSSTNIDSSDASVRSHSSLDGKVAYSQSSPIVLPKWFESGTSSSASFGLTTVSPTSSDERREDSLRRSPSSSDDPSGDVSVRSILVSSSEKRSSGKGSPLVRRVSFLKDDTRIE